MDYGYKADNEKSSASQCAAEVGPGKRYNTVEEHLDAKMGENDREPLKADFPDDTLKATPSPVSFVLKK